ncbi:MAG: hypothetical protein ABI627_07015 [Polyangiaceae bacterium]
MKLPPVTVGAAQQLSLLDAPQFEARPAQLGSTVHVTPVPAYAALLYARASGQTDIRRPLDEVQHHRVGTDAKYEL